MEKKFLVSHTVWIIALHINYLNLTILLNYDSVILFQQLLECFQNDTLEDWINLSVLRVVYVYKESSNKHYLLRNRISLVQLDDYKLLVLLNNDLSSCPLSPF